MTAERLTILLAERVMGWSVGPDRYLMGERRWLPRWRFQPLVNLADAVRLLDGSNGTYKVTRDLNRRFSAEVCIADHCGSATGEILAATVTVALARAVGLEIDEETARTLRVRTVRPDGGRRSR